MKIYPAIDIYNGEAVRLEQGKKEKMKSFGDPVEYAERFSRYVDKLHIVDLEGAFEGESRNLDVVEQIVNLHDIKVQVGGGLREISSVKKAYSAGAENVIVGTRAFDEEFMEEITDEFEGITVSLDLKGGSLAVDGWRTTLDMDLKKGLEFLGSYVDRFIYTITEQDGLLEGIKKVPYVAEVGEVIYAGGVTSMKDIDLLDEMNFDGCIIGKALYEKKISLKELKRRGDQYVG
ncbi:MAG: 1-(5-phosphoribosyl)-5-((5-phosphoribosylamino)methylideneamino)imidazole-4-carboxamide isomerase [Candidatus Thermoplasmatota archaeon]